MSTEESTQRYIPGEISDYQRSFFEGHSDKLNEYGSAAKDTTPDLEGYEDGEWAGLNFTLDEED